MSTSSSIAVWGASSGRLPRPGTVRNPLQLGYRHRHIVGDAPSLVLDNLGNHRALQPEFTVKFRRNTPPVAYAMGMFP